jgi:hypothetical protein
MKFHEQNYESKIALGIEFSGQTTKITQTTLLVLPLN